MSNFSFLPQNFSSAPRAGRYKSVLDEVGLMYGGADKIPDDVKKEIASKAVGSSFGQDAEFAGVFGPLITQQAYNLSPQGRKEILQQQLEFDKARGEQMQKYRMINDTIANVGQAARAAAGGYGLSPDYVGQSVANVGNAYLAGLQSMPRIAPQVGQRYF